jgi:hypothetical protein
MSLAIAAFVAAAERSMAYRYAGGLRGDPEHPTQSLGRIQCQIAWDPLSVLTSAEFGTHPGFLMPVPRPSTVNTRDRELSTHSLLCRHRRRLTPIASLRH